MFWGAINLEARQNAFRWNENHQKKAISNQLDLPMGISLSYPQVVDSRNLELVGVKDAASY